MTLGECLRMYQTGGLRRRADGNPLEDMIESSRTSMQERGIANHPSLKPQAFLRQIVYAALPLGTGVIVDPFMGSVSTVAAALAMNLQCIGIERQSDYYEMAKHAIIPLSQIDNEKQQLPLRFS